MTDHSIRNDIFRITFHILRVLFRSYKTCITSYIDINECIMSIDDCHSAATCTNTIGSYTCTCNTGYTGDGQTCIGNKIHVLLY